MCDTEITEMDEINAAYVLLDEAKQYIANKDNEKAKEKLIELLHTHLKAVAAFEYGKIMLEEGDNYKARLCFNKLVEYGGSFGVSALHKLAELEESLGNKKGAIEYYEKAVERDPSTYTLNKLIKLYSKYSDADKIKKAYEMMLDTEGRNFALLSLAKIEANKKNYSQARIYLNELIETKDEEGNLKYSDKDRAYALLELGKLEVACENYDEARNCFEKLILFGGKNELMAMLELGRLENKLENYDLARKYFEWLLHTESRNFALVELGKLESKFKNYDKALEYFNELIELGGKDKELALQEIVKIGSDTEDIEVLKNALKLSDDNTEGKAFILVKLGTLSLSLNEKEQALDYFIQLKSLEYDHKYNADYYLGISYENLKNYEEAKKYYISVINTDKVYRSIAFRNLGGIEYLEKNIEKAIEYFEQFVEMTDDNKIMAPLNTSKLEETVLLLGKLYMSVDKDIKARACFKMLIKNEFSNKNSAKLELARLEKKLDNKDESKRILEELLDTPNRKYALLELGMLLIDMEQYDQSEIYLKELKTYGGRDELLATHYLVELKHKLKKFDEAKTLLEKLKDTEDRHFALVKLGNIANIYYEFGKAIEYLTTAIKEAEDSGEKCDLFAILELGRAYSRSGNTDKAIPLFESLKDTDFENQANLELARIKLEDNEEEAIRLFESLKGTDYENLSKYELARIKFKYNEEEAIEMMNELLDTEMRGLALIFKGKFEEDNGLVNTARKHFEEAYDYLDRPNYAVQEQGLLEIQIGNYDKAREIFERLEKESDPFKSFAIIKLGDIECLFKNYDAARTQYLKLLNTKYNEIALICLTNLELEVGNCCLARTYIEELLNNQSTDITRLLDCIVCLEIYQENIEKASELIKQYKDSFKNSDYYRYREYISCYKEGNTNELHSSGIIKHISNRHFDMFKPGVSIDDLYYDIRKKLAEDNVQEYNVACRNKIHIEFDDVVSTIDGEDTKVVEVVYLIDKTNIVTMYPVIWYGDTIKLNQKVKKIKSVIQ